MTQRELAPSLKCTHLLNPIDKMPSLWFTVATRGGEVPLVDQTQEQMTRMQRMQSQRCLFHVVDASIVGQVCYVIHYNIASKPESRLQVLPPHYQDFLT